MSLSDTILSEAIAKLTRTVEECSESATECLEALEAGEDA